MGKSYKKVIAFGKSCHGRRGRNKTWGDWAAEKARKEGKPVPKQHFRHRLQTLEDYKEYVLSHMYVETPYNDMFDRRRFGEYLEFLNGREETQELADEFALKLYNKDRSK